MGTEHMNSSHVFPQPSFYHPALHRGWVYSDLIPQPQMPFAIPLLKGRDRGPAQAAVTQSTHNSYTQLFDQPSKSHCFIPTQKEVLCPASCLLLKLFC